MKYETEKQFFHMTKTSYELESLFVFSIQQMSARLKNNELPESGTIQMDVGYATFEIVDESEAEKTFLIQCYTSNGGNHTAWITFDQTTNQIIGWNEF